MKKPIDYKYFAIKYVFEFFVVVLGITVSFWVGEWNEQRKLANDHIAEAKAILKDLSADAQRLEFIAQSIKQGETNASRLIDNIERYRGGLMSYSAFSDSIIDIGHVYTEYTFFINNGTYKSLINNGRILRFPLGVETEVKDYYEFVSKRVADNNRMVDDAAWSYYSEHHPMCYAIENLDPTESRTAAYRLLQYEDLKAQYSSASFYKANIALRHRIQMHGDQVQGYQNKCLLVDSLVRAHLEEITALH